MSRTVVNKFLLQFLVLVVAVAATVVFAGQQAVAAPVKCTGDFTVKTGNNDGSNAEYSEAWVSAVDDDNPEHQLLGRPYYSGGDLGENKGTTKYNYGSMNCSWAADIRYFRVDFDRHWWDNWELVGLVLDVHEQGGDRVHARLCWSGRYWFDTSKSVWFAMSNC